jgi:Enterobacterial TraT complement resistance protein
MQVFKLMTIAMMLSTLLACGAAQKGIRYGKLDVQTKMSASLFLEPVEPSQQTIFIQARNTSDKPGVSIDQDLRNALQNKGYQVVSSPKQAHYLLQVNVLQVGKQREEDTWRTLNGGWGSALGGAATGAVAGGLFAHSDKGVLVGGLLGGAISSVADSMVEVITYTMTTDIQISEKTNGTVVTETSESRLAQGTSGHKTSSYKEAGNRKRYQTRIVSMAQKTNLKFEDAEPALKQGLANSVAGLF